MRLFLHNAKNFLIRNHHTTRKFLALILIGTTLSAFFSHTPRAWGTTYSFSQDDWSGGASALTASHPANQSDWTRFGTSTNITVNPDGSLSLPQVGYTATDGATLSSTGSASGGGFPNGDTTNSVANSSVELSTIAPNSPWTALTAAPLTIGAGASLEYPGSGDYIYVLRGAGTVNFYRYSISDNSWSSLASAPATMGDGSGLVYPGYGDYLYAARGGTNTEFYRYSISGNTWDTRAAAGAVYTGGDIVSDGGDYLYMLRGNSTNVFTRYSISSNSWATMAVVPTTVAGGGSLVYPGSGNYIYATAGGNYWYRYSISGNTWSALTFPSYTSGVGASLAYPGSGDYIIAVMSNNSSPTNILRYSISTDTWALNSVLLDRTGAGGNSVAVGRNIYMLPGVTTTKFYKYSVDDDLDTWEAKQDAPSSVYTTSAAPLNIGNYIYTFHGNNAYFSRYSIADNTWASMQDAPAFIGNGGALYYPGSGDFIYATGGSSLTKFYRYSISGNSWVTLAATPSAVGNGGSLVGSGNYIYLMAGNNSTGFYRYSIPDDTWSTLAIVPAAVNGGGALTYPGSGDYIYALRGNASVSFYRYSISGNTWSNMAVVPWPVGAGGAMAYPGSGDYLYVLRGSGTVHFYRYSMSTNAWTDSMAATPVAASNGAGLVYANGKLYMLVANTTTKLYAFSFPRESSGSYTSAVIDLGGISSLSTLAYSATTPSGTAVTFDVRAGNTAIPDGNWTSWQTGVSNGGSIAGLSGNRYVQYRANLSTSNTANSPTVSSVTMGYTQHAASGNLISSAFNTSDASNVIGSLTWAQDSSLPAGTYVGVALRAASASAGLDAASWSTLTSTSTGCSAASGVVSCALAAIPAGLKDGTGDQWVQYKVVFSSNGVSTPTVTSVGFQYVVNAPPEFDAAYGTGGVRVEQVATSTYANYGKVAIDYSVRDADGDTGSVTPLKITPTFEYNTGSGWLEIPDQYLGEDDISQKTISTTNYTIHSAAWDIQSHLPDQYLPSVQVRVRADDGEAANNIAVATSSTISVDTKKPVVGAYTLDVGARKVALSLTDNGAIQYRLSNNGDLSADGANASSGEWQEGSAAVSELITWTFTGNNPTVYLVAKDAFGNTIATTSAVAPALPVNFDLKDTSNTNSGDYRIFLSWAIAPSDTGATFQKYEIYRSTDGGSTYALRSSVNDANVNYYTDTGLSSNTTYYYKIKVVDTDGDASDYSTTVSDIPDGQGGTDFTAPAISDVEVENTQTTWAKIIWTTDELSTSKVEYAAADAATPYASSVTSGSYVLDHEITLTGLQPNTEYNFRVKSTDIYNNNATDDDSGQGYSFTTSAGTSISDVAVEYVSDNQAIVVWNTAADSDSFVEYSTDLDGLISGESIAEAGTSDFVGVASNSGSYQHRVTLTGLEPRTTYFFYVKSTDGEGDTAIDTNGGDYYRFFTTFDTKPPTIANISTPVVTSDSVVVIWTTDELSDSKLAYGTASGELNTQTATNDTMTISHVMTLTDLEPNTPYFYKVISADAQGNESDSDEKTVTTSATGETTIIYASSGGGGSSSADTVAPTISDITASSTGPFSAKVSFTTSESATSFVSYRTDGGDAQIAGSPTFATKHSINLRGLQMGTQYRYQIKAQDKAGNFGQSQEASFSTPYVAEALKDLVTLKNAADFQDQLENLIESALPSLVPPFIANVAVSSTTESAALVTWRTNTPTYGSVLYVTEEEYNPAKDKPYLQEIAKTGEKATEHSLELTNLSPATKYHFQVRGYSLPGVVGTSKDMTFATKSSRIRPEIASVGNTDFEIRWTTPKKTSSIIEYKDIASGKTKRVEDSQQSFTHSVRVEDLEPNKSYQVRAYGFDANNTLIEGETLSIRTTRDAKPPVISSVQIDNALLPGRTDRLQTVVSWKTDEPSDGKVLYEEGVGASTALSQSVRQDIFATEHILIIPALKPSTVYRIKIESKDTAGNIGSSTVKTILTPHSAENIIDVIVKNLQESFGFLNNLR